MINIEITNRVGIKGNFNVEFSFLVDCFQMIRLVTACDDNVIITQKNNQIEISSGKFKSNLRLLDHTNFSIIPKIDGPKVTLSYPKFCLSMQKALQALNLNIMSHAMTRSTAALQITGDELNIYATNGISLFKTKISVQSEIEETKDFMRPQTV